MKILSIDSSSLVASCAIVEDDILLAEYTVCHEKTHSQKLMPLIDEIFKESKYKLDDIDLLACCTGPGSFTGLRIGISTVKAFSDVTKIPVCRC